jgi:cytochrome c-type biogenesis protein CcmH
MILWLALGALTLATLWFMLHPLFRVARTLPAREAYDVEVYRDQLAEVKRDEARGLLSPAEARAAEREIARRLLAVAPQAETHGRAETAAAAPGRTARRWTAMAVAALVPLASLGLYLYVGAPEAPDFPFAQRAAIERAAGMPDIDAAIQHLQARLKAKPDDLEGWLLLGRSEAALRRFPEAIAAYQRADALSPGRADIIAALAEMKVMAAGGTVDAETKAMFEQVHAKDPTEIRARFYLGLAKVQGGDPEGGLRDWLALEASTPADAPWRVLLQGQIERIAKQFKLDPAKLAPAGVKAPSPAASTASPGPSAADIAAAQNMTPAEREQVVRGMVGKLAAQLQQQPDDLEGWRRLGRAYGVLGEPGKAADALAHAAKLAPENPDVLVEYGQSLAAQAKPGDKLPAQAIVVMRQVLTLDHRRPEALWYVGLAEAERDDKAAAAALWNRLLAQLSPGTPAYDKVKQRLDGLGVTR